MVSIIEFLYQIHDRLKIENLLVPLPLLRQPSNVIDNQAAESVYILLSKAFQIVDAYKGHNMLQSSFWSAGIRVGQRSNALIGHILAMLLSN